MPSRKDVAASIQRRIELGEWKPGDRLPVTEDLAEQYGVSDSTIFNAMEKLKDRGIVRGERGGRRYVAERTEELTNPDLDVY